jgi:predicted methyltransferase
MIGLLGKKVGMSQIFDGEGQFLRDPKDKQSVSVFDKSIRGETDQFVYRFRKPGRARR